MMTIFEKASMIIAALGAPAALWIGDAVGGWIRRNRSTDGTDPAE